MAIFQFAMFVYQRVTFRRFQDCFTPDMAYFCRGFRTITLCTSPGGPSGWGNLLRRPSRPLQKWRFSLELLMKLGIPWTKCRFLPGNKGTRHTWAIFQEVVLEYQRIGVKKRLDKFFCVGNYQDLDLDLWLINLWMLMVDFQRLNYGRIEATEVAWDLVWGYVWSYGYNVLSAD